MAEQNDGLDDPGTLAEMAKLLRTQLSLMTYVYLIIHTRESIGQGMAWSDYPWGELMEAARSTSTDVERITAWISEMVEKHGTGTPGAALSQIITKVGIAITPSGAPAAQVSERGAPTIDAFSGLN